jgi:hypothetical protein
MEISFCNKNALDITRIADTGRFPCDTELQSQIAKIWKGTAIFTEMVLVAGTL